MRKLSITLVLIAISFMAMEASTSLRHRRGKRIEFKSWNEAQRNPVFIPIEATIENNYIEAQFFISQDNPVTFQVKDEHGGILFQDIVTPNDQETYKIDLKGFKVGHYTLFYIEEDITFIGEFEIEHSIP